MTGVLSVPSPRKAVGEALSDHELVARVRSGDDRAFEILFERYQGRITAYIRGMVRDHGRAEDITQEVFFNALRRMRGTDRAIAFRPWIYEIAKNACIDAHRRSRRTQEVSYDNDEALGAADHSRLVSPRAVPETVETRESLESLQGALGALSESHVDVIVLRELEGRSYAEIGEQLGMSRASVESTLFRARKRLESEYNDLVTGERCRQVQAAFATMSGGRPRLRDRRQISRHLAWCQACRHQARLAGLDIEVAPRVPLRKKVGGLFPVPAFIREWLARGVLPGQIAGVGEPLFEWGRAAVAAVAVAVAGIGAGQIMGGGPVVDARPYAPGAAVYGGVGATPVLGKAYALVGTQPGLRHGGGGGLALPGTGALGAPLAAGPLAPQASALAGGTGAAGTLPAGLRNPVLAAGAAVGGAGGTLGGTVGGVTGSVGGAVGGLAGTTGGTVRGLTNTVNGTVQGTTGTVGGAVRDVGGTAGGAARDVTGTTNNTVGGVTRTASGLVRDVTSNPTNVGGAVDNAVRNTTQTVRGTVRDTSSTVDNTVRNTTGTAGNAVQGVTGTVDNTVRNTTDTVSGTVGGVTQTTTQAVQGAVNSLPTPTATTQAAPAPAPTAPQPTPTTQQQAPAVEPVRQVVEDTTSALGGLLGGG
jgi:RNA polymerase sigma factor (sigma-70 family)